MYGGVVLLPPGVALPHFSARRRSDLNLPDDDFLFLNLFDMTSGVERKNPFAIIAAFRQAFRPEEPVRLVLKVSRAHHNRTRWNQLQEIARADSKLTLLDTILSRDDTLALMASAAPMFSAPVGGFWANPCRIDAPGQASGGNCLFRQHYGFMTPDNSYLVDFEIAPLPTTADLRRGMCWAEPSVAHAAIQMRAIFEDRARAKAVGERAQMELKKALDPLQAGLRMRRRLEDIRARRQVRANKIC